MAFESDVKPFCKNAFLEDIERKKVKRGEAYLGDMSQPCCMNAAKENHKLLMILKSLAMLDVGICGEP